MKKKTVRMNTFLSFFSFSIFGKNGKIENRVRNRRLVQFSHFSNDSEKSGLQN